jgi:hypothetical protein
MAYSRSWSKTRYSVVCMSLNRSNSKLSFHSENLILICHSRNDRKCSCKLRCNERYLCASCDSRIIIGNINWNLSISWKHTGGAEVWLHSFLTQALVLDKRTTARPLGRTQVPRWQPNDNHQFGYYCRGRRAVVHVPLKLLYIPNHMVSHASRQ